MYFTAVKHSDMTNTLFCPVKPPDHNVWWWLILTWPQQRITQSQEHPTRCNISNNIILKLGHLNHMWTYNYWAQFIFLLSWLFLRISATHERQNGLLELLACTTIHTEPLRYPVITQILFTFESIRLLQAEHYHRLLYSHTSLSSISCRMQRHLVLLWLQHSLHRN